MPTQPEETLEQRRYRLIAEAAIAVNDATTALNESGLLAAVTAAQANLKEVIEANR